jgi:hypothetical protein
MSQSADTISQNIEAMFVQSAHGLTSIDNTLTLVGTSPSTLFFADRPDRVVGHVHTNTFVSEWAEGENSFEEDPPNAVISFLQESDVVPEEVTVVISNPELKDNNLSYKIEVLDGALPASAGACALFIDPIGRPLSPMSIAGVRRRRRRRGF